MKLSRKLIAGLAAFAMAGAVSAQEFDDFGGFDDFGSDTSDFGGSSSGGGVTIGGQVEMAGRAYVDDWDDERNEYSVTKLDTEAKPSAKLDFEYEGANTDFSLRLKLDKNSLGDYKWDILDEFTARAYVGNLQLEAGKMRVVWGKCDKLHVLDNFNANDYTDYIIPDYIDRRISEPMFRLVYATPSNVKVEAIYTPVMTADRLGTGRWEPKAAKKLTKTVTDYVYDKIGPAASGGNGAELAKWAGFKADSLYPNTNQFQYGQAGVRTTFTVGSVDLGFSYYYGHNKQPSADTSSMFNAAAAAKMKAAANASPLGYMADSVFDSYNSANLPSLDYDAVNIFGFEGAAILGRLNTRWELAYNMTKDIAGDDPWVHNNSLNWVAGFDCDIPVHNININIQTQGKYILNNDKIGDAEFSPLDGTAFAAYASRFKASYKEYDVDYDANGCYTNNKIVLDITDTWNLEKIKLDLKGIWGIERGDLIVIPTLTFKIKDDFNLNLMGMYIWCKNSDSEFDGWEHNSFAQIGCKYQF